MRTLTPAALAKARSFDDVEPVIVVVLADGRQLADHDYKEALGRIITCSSVNVQVSEGGVGSAGSLSLKIDDSELVDIHTDLLGTIVKVYQTWVGIDDRVELLRGRVSSPLVWSEDQRTLEFDLVSLYHYTEVPFAPDEDSGLQEFAWDQAWPRIYGTPVDVPAVQVIRPSEGRLIRELRVRDTYADFEVDDTVEFTLGEQTLEINNEWMTGTLVQLRSNPTTQLRFYIKERNVSKGTITSLDRSQLVTIEAAPTGFDSWQYDPRYSAWDLGDHLVVGNWLLLTGISGTLQAGRVSTSYFTASHLYGQVAYPSFVGYKNYILSAQGNATRGQFPWVVASGLLYIGINATADIRGVLDVNDTLHAEGSTVREIKDSVYVCSDRQGVTVRQVRAWRQVTEQGVSRRELVVVPSSLYTVKNETIAGRACVTVTLAHPLSARNGGWEDELFVTATSPITNVADVVEDLLGDLEADAASFASVKAANTYPLDFAVLSISDSLELAGRVAYQARCGLITVGSVAYLTYLSARPPQVHAFGDEVLEATLQLSTTTVSLNDYTVTWRRRYSQDRLNRIRRKDDSSILKFGREEREEEWFIYRYRELVKFSVDFWFNRGKQPWRVARVTTMLDALPLTVYDGVFLSDRLTTLAVVQALEHNLDSCQIGAELLTPILSGQEDEDSSFWMDEIDFTAPELSFPDDIITEKIEVEAESFPEVAVGVANGSDVDGVFDATLYRSNSATGEVEEESVQVNSLSGGVSDGDVVTVFRAKDGTYFTKVSGGGTQVLSSSGVLLIDIEDPAQLGVSRTDSRWTTAVPVEQQAAYTQWYNNLLSQTSIAERSLLADVDLGKVFADAAEVSEKYYKPTHPSFNKNSIYAYLAPQRVNPSGDFFSGTVVNVDSEGYSATTERRVGIRVSGASGAGRAVVNIADDGTLWYTGSKQVVALAEVRSDSGNKDAIPVNLYIEGLTDGIETSVKLPALADTAKVSAGTWIVAIKMGSEWYGYLPLIRPRVPA